MQSYNGGLIPLVQLMLIIFIAKVFGGVARRYRQPEVLGELAAGIILGPSILGLITKQPFFELLAEFGLILLLFEVGLETDVRTLMRTSRSSLLIALGGAFVPLLLGYYLGLALGYSPFVSMFLGATFTATSVGISIRVFSDIGKLQTEEAKTILGAAVYDDIIGLLLLSILFGLQAHDVYAFYDVVRITLYSTIFLGVSLMLGAKIFPKVMRYLAHLPSRGIHLASALMLGLLSSYISINIGLSSIVGAFIAGVLLAESPEKDKIRRDLAPLSYIIVPIFFILIGVAVDIKFTFRLLVITIIVVALAVIGKFLGSGLGAYVSKFNRYQIPIIGAAMIPRGEVGLIFAKQGFQSGIYDPDLYSALITMAIVTTLIAPPILRRLYMKQKPEMKVILTHK